MKIVKLLLAVLTVLIIVGCSDNDVKEESSSKSTQENNERIGIPPKLDAYANQVQITTKLAKSCWEEEEKCSIVHTKKAETVLQDTEPTKVKPGQIITIQLSTNGTDDKYWKSKLVPNQIEVISIKENEQTKVKLENDKIKAPSGEGKYYISVLVQWDNEIKGAANYVFALDVKEDS